MIMLGRMLGTIYPEGDIIVFVQNCTSNYLLIDDISKTQMINFLVNLESSGVQHNAPDASVRSMLRYFKR